MDTHVIWASTFWFKNKKYKQIYTWLIWHQNVDFLLSLRNPESSLDGMHALQFFSFPAAYSLFFLDFTHV